LYIQVDVTNDRSTNYSMVPVSSFVSPNPDPKAGRTRSPSPRAAGT
jgi:hypothetical protein